MEDNYYEVLGISEDATEKEIKQAYKKLAVKWHPDKHKDKGKAELKFKGIAEAYQVLSDPEKRDIYDTYGKKGLEDDFNPYDYDFDDIFDDEDIGNFRANNFFGPTNISPDELFEQFFKFKSPFGKGSEFDKIFNNHSNFKNQSYSKSNMKPKTGKGEDVEYELNCTLEHLYKGKSKKFKIKRKIYDGNSVQYEEKHIDINVKPGWKDGKKVVYENFGDVIPNQVPGDIVFIVKQLPHKIYDRVDDDLEVDCSITLTEALQGFSRTLKTLDGKTQIIKMCPLKSSDEKYVLDGCGMPIRENKKVVGYGDILVKFHIDLKGVDKRRRDLITNILKS